MLNGRLNIVNAELTQAVLARNYIKISGKKMNILQARQILFLIFWLSVVNCKIADGQKLDSHKARPSEGLGIIAVGGSANIQSETEVELHFVILLEKDWDTFGFSPNKGIEITNRLEFTLPEGLEISGDAKVISPPVIDGKYFGSETPVARYSDRVEIKQSATVEKEIDNFSDLRVTGKLYCQVHRGGDSPNSLAMKMPFTLHFRKLTVGQLKQLEKNKTKVPGAENESDTVKTKAKPPE